MKAPYPSFTETWHNTTYDGISPTLPNVSAAKKTVVITGAGSGVGRATALAFAAAGAAHIAMIGRHKESLADTCKEVSAKSKTVKVTAHPADVADEDAMEKVAKEIGNWDILIMNAGVTTNPKSIQDSKVSDWWRVFETNVRGSMITAHVLLPLRKRNASIIGIAGGIVSVPAAYIPGNSAFTSSKIAQIKMMEHLALECPDAQVVNVHPGVIDTKLQQDLNYGKGLAFDDVELPAHFIVWAASPEAGFLHGRFVWANWDVDELIDRAEEIQSSRVLVANIHGWPFA